MGTRIQNHRNGIVTLAPCLLPERRPLSELPTHRHEGEFEWFFCVAGGGTQAVGSWQHSVRPGQLLLIPPGEPHVFAARSPGGCRCEVLMMPFGFPEGEDKVAVEARQLLGFWRKRVQERGFIAELPERAARRGGELMRRIRRWSEQPGFGDTLRTHAALLELLALAFELDDPPRFRPGTEAPRRNRTLFPRQPLLPENLGDGGRATCRNEPKRVSPPLRPRNRNEFLRLSESTPAEGGIRADR